MINISLLKKTVFVIAIIVLLPQPGSSQNNVEPRYKVGQVWSYKTRPSEEQSTITIVKLETDPKLGKIVHISVTGLKIKTPNSELDYTTDIGHMPFAEKAIDKSVVKLINENGDLPNYEEGYAEWRHEFEENKAGIYKITIAEAIAKAEKHLKNLGERK